MWLLDTSTAQLHFFTSPEAVDGGYAILSHCWDSSGEQTFQEIQSIARRCAMLRLSPRRFVAKKIRRFCELAEENGYRWAWCDTCCIDKTSSADLSEAINSMFRYYSLAQVCYAYLADVSRGCTLDDATGEFYYSRWHARGWTLQELVAPRVVVFLAADWSTLATKTEIATVLQDISGVPMSVLTFEQDMADMGVARRLSWAGSRSTTRPEDEAYCLMGFFGINMPVLYGEGTRAFYRLQEEIMKTSMDPTLFIWGTYLPFEKATLLSSAVDEPPRFLDTTIGNVAPYLFAARPANMSIQCDFDGPIRAYTSAPPLTPSPVSPEQEIVDIPAFTTTPYGILAHVPVIDLPAGCSVALLSCSNNYGPLGLLITRDTVGPGAVRPVYRCSWGHFRIVRLKDIPCDGSLGELKPTWRDIYLTTRPPFRALNAVASGPSLILISMSNITTSPFRFPLAVLDALASRETPGSCHYLDAIIGGGPGLRGGTWTGAPPMTLVFRHHWVEGHRAFVTLGRCESDSKKRIPRLGSHHGERGWHWATVQFESLQTNSNIGANEASARGPFNAGTFPQESDEELNIARFGGHTCPEDHIASWHARKRRFEGTIDLSEDVTRAIWVELAFEPYRMNKTGGTLALLGLTSYVGDEMLCIQPR